MKTEGVEGLFEIYHSKAEIHHCQATNMFVPNFYKLPDSDAIFCDIFGHHQSEKFQTIDFVHFFTVRHILQKAKNVKFLAVMTRDSTYE